MVEGLHRFAKLFAIDSAAIGSSLAFFEGAIKPDHSIETTLDKHLRRLFFSCGLNKKESLFHLRVTFDLLKLWVWHIATKSLLKKLSLGIVAWEIDQDPA